MIENQNGIIVTEQKVLAKTGQTALIVAGMHRSGTSALTKVLNILGAGLPNNLMPPGEYNLRGFCESESIRQIHDQILASAGSYWDNTSGIPSAWFASPAAPEYEEKLLEILVQDMSELPLYVIKDPRICRVIPLWLKVFKRLGTEVRFILPLRHPLEIAASLKKRDGFDTNKSLLLWLGYFLDAERYTRGHIRCFVPYDNLLTSWRNVVGHLEKELEIVFPRQGHLATIEIEQFLCNGLRHHDLSREDLSGRSDIANWISQAFAWGMAASRGEKVYPEELDNIREAFQEADKIYGPLVTNYDLLQNKQGHLLEEFRLTVDKQQQSEERLTQIQAQLHNVESENLQHKEESIHLYAQLERTQSDLNQAHAQLEGVNTEFNQARAQLENVLGELAHSHSLLEQRESQLSNITKELEYTQAELNEAREQLEQNRVKAIEEKNLREELAQVGLERMRLESELIQAQGQLKQSQTMLTLSQAEVKQAKSELAQTHQQMQRSYQEWEQAQHQLEQAQSGWERAHIIIEAMESSKFWQLRQKWFKIKPLLGLKVK